MLNDSSPFFKYFVISFVHVSRYENMRDKLIAIHSHFVFVQCDKDIINHLIILSININSQVFNLLPSP